MIAKPGIVEEESDETLYWLELLVESGRMPEARLSNLMTDVDEIVAMTASSIKTLREKRQEEP
ncbi:MAG: four helix bundle protein [Anaerolineae bacterium]